MIEDEIISFMKKNNLDANECADKLGLKVEQIEKIEEQPLNLSTEEQKRILDIISIEAKSFDEIINLAQEDVSLLMVALTELEIKGIIVQRENKYHKC